MDKNSRDMGSPSEPQTNVLKRMASMFRKHPAKKREPDADSRSCVYTPSGLSDGASLRRRNSNRSQNSYYMKNNVIPVAMPAPAEVDKLFAHLIETSISANKLPANGLSLTTEQKWAFIVNSDKLQDRSGRKNTPEFYLDYLQGASDKDLLNEEMVSALRIQLTNQPISYA